MSKISTVYDAVLTALAALYPNKTRIPNTFLVSENPEQFLRDGYGLRIDSEAPAPSEFQTFSRYRIFTVLLSKEVLTTDMQTSQMDTATKALLEETYNLEKDFMNADQIAQEAAIEAITMAGTSQIIPIINERVNFILMEVSFSIQITDTI